MPRPARLHLEGVLYYVISRGEPEAPLFRDDQDVRTYLDFLSFYKAQYGFKLYAYTLSSSQVQLCLEAASGTTISKIMHALNSRYTKVYSKRYHRSGHLFQGRYRATVLEKEPSLLPLTRYLHAQTDALTTSLPQYQRPDSSWVDREEVFRLFAQADLQGKSALEEARQGYEVYVQSTLPEETQEWRRMLEQPVVGSSDFLRAAEQAKAKEQGHAADTYSGGEPLLMPERRGEGPWRKLLSAAAILGLLYSVGSVAFLSGIVVKQAESNKQVQVVFQAPTLAAQSASTLVYPEEPASLLATAIPEAPLRLNGTQWDIQISPMYARNGIPTVQDQIIFGEGWMTSNALSAEGFPAADITVTPQKEGRLIWETMQAHSNGETVFWRGELTEGRMQGIFSRHLKEGAPQDFIFRGVLRSASEVETERTL